MQNINSMKRHSLVNRNITVRDPESAAEIRTSIRLEIIEWEAMKKICLAKGVTVNQFCCEADQSSNRREHSRTSRIRTAILNHFMNTELAKRDRKNARN